VSFNNFPALSSAALITIPQDDWIDPDVVTLFEDQQSVEVQSTGSGGFYLLTVRIQCPEADADTIFTFLKGQRLRAIPFNFTHRKRGTIVVRYWPSGSPPTLPYKRLVAGSPDLVEFDLPLRQEAGT
jgi:hypothetical protein